MFIAPSETYLRNPSEMRDLKTTGMILSRILRASNTKALEDSSIAVVPLVASHVSAGFERRSACMPTLKSSEAQLRSLLKKGPWTKF